MTPLEDAREWAAGASESDDRVLVAALDEAEAECDELRAKLAEIDELAGAGGDGTTFGRVESALSDWAGRASEAEARAEAAEKREAAMRAALERLKGVLFGATGCPSLDDADWEQEAHAVLESALAEPDLGAWVPRAELEAVKRNAAILGGGK